MICKKRPPACEKFTRASTKIQSSISDGKQKNRLVGAPGFEPGASCAQGRRATRLRYAPTVINSYSTGTCNCCLEDSNSSVCRKCARMPKIYALDGYAHQKKQVPKSLKTSPRIRTLTSHWNSWK